MGCDFNNSSMGFSVGSEGGLSNYSVGAGELTCDSQMTGGQVGGARRSRSRARRSRARRSRGRSRVRRSRGRSRVRRSRGRSRARRSRARRSKKVDCDCPKNCKQCFEHKCKGCNNCLCKKKSKRRSSRRKSRRGKSRRVKAGSSQQQCYTCYTCGNTDHTTNACPLKGIGSKKDMINLLLTNTGSQFTVESPPQYECSGCGLPMNKTDTECEVCKTPQKK